MKTYVAGNGWRSGDDQPVGRHRRTNNDTGASSRLHTELREEQISHQVTIERRHVEPLSRLVQPVHASQVSRTLLDASLLDLLD